jgi:trk system potassium uptake protein TrkA
LQSIRSTAANDDHAQILRAVGATDTIFPERDAAERLARKVANPDIRDMFPLSEAYRIMEIKAPGKAIGKTLAELELRKSFDLLILATRAPHEREFHFLPPADKTINPEEILMVLGRELDLARFDSYD